MSAVYNLSKSYAGVNPAVASVQSWFYGAPFAYPSAAAMPSTPAEVASLNAAHFIVYEGFTGSDATGASLGRGSIDSGERTVVDLLKHSSFEDLLAAAFPDDPNPPPLDNPIDTSELVTVRLDRSIRISDLLAVAERLPSPWPNPYDPVDVIEVVAAAISPPLIVTSDTSTVSELPVAGFQGARVSDLVANSELVRAQIGTMLIVASDSVTTTERMGYPNALVRYTPINTFESVGILIENFSITLTELILSTDRIPDLWPNPYDPVDVIESVSLQVV